MTDVSPPLPDRFSGVRTRVPRVRLVILVGALLGLLAGLNAALGRLGLEAPLDNESLASAHGVLMLYGFIGTAILLERAVAVQANRQRFAWLAYLAPLASVVAVILTLIEASPLTFLEGRLLPGLAWSVSFFLLIVIYLVIYQKQPATAVLIQLLGAIGGWVGIVLWTRGFEIPQIFPWWMSFLVLTIVGERIELARIAFIKSGIETRILFESLVMMIALVVTLFNPGIGYPVLGIALTVLVVDTATHDVARHTIKTQGLTRFMAACMLSGYAWALVASGIWVLGGPIYGGFAYDTVVHVITIGFALSMILAHAPVIIPAVARKELPYNLVMWAVWLTLEGGLLIRVVAGVRNSTLVWQFGGSIGVAAILAFVATTVSLILIGGRPR